MSYRNAMRAGLILLLSAWLAACSGSGGGGDDDQLSLRDLNGTWTTPCLFDGAVTLMATLNITNGAAILQLVTYSDMLCMSIMMDEIETYDFELGAVVEVDGSVDGIVVATRVDITNTTIGSPDIGEVDYDLIAVKGNTMYFGDTDGANDGSTPALRPTQLDGDIYFVKM